MTANDEIQAEMNAYGNMNDLIQETVRKAEFKEAYCLTNALIAMVDEFDCVSAETLAKFSIQSKQLKETLEAIIRIISR